MNVFYEHHQDSVRFGYRCFDRILFNGLIQPFLQAERVVGFFSCGSPKPKTPPLSTCNRCNYESALSIHIWAESREVSASDRAGRNQIGDAFPPDSGAS